MGTINPKLNNYTWENLSSFDSIFSEKTYKILSRFKENEDKENFHDTLEILIEVDSKILKKIESKYKEIDNLSTKKIAEALEINAYESFLDKKIYISKALKTIEINKNKDKDKDSDHADLLSNLACFYFEKCEYNKSFDLQNEALTIRKNNLGKNHIETSLSYRNLADIYYHKGMYSESLGLYQRSKEITIENYGLEHPETAKCYFKLANCYISKGDYKLALELGKDALEIRESILGKEHPYTADSYQQLSGLYILLGDYNLALPMCQKAIDIKEKEFGKRHHFTASAYSTLADFYKEKKEFEQSLPLRIKALEISKKNLGNYNIETAKFCNGLASNYIDLGKTELAMPLLKEALTISVRIFDYENLLRAKILNNIALLYFTQEKYDEVEKSLEESTNIAKIFFDSNHPALATMYANLGVNHYIQGNYEESLPLFQKALLIREKKLGITHKETTRIHAQINTLKQKQNKLFFLNEKNSRLNFYIDRLDLENFKQYEKFSIDFSPKINIIIGQNATGKTTLLQAITLAILKEESPDEEKSYTKFIRKNEEKSKLIVSHNEKTKTVLLLKEKREIDSNYFIPFILSYGSNFFTKYDISTEIIVENILNETINEGFSHSIFLDYVDEFWNPLTILRELTRNTHNQSKVKKEILFNTINNFLEPENYRLIEKNEKFFFHKDGDNTELHLGNLSEGYRGTVLLITDMVIKVLGVGWTPETIEGVILIDEFDKHLHPKWQSQLVSKLTDTFPRVQFIMTTHNPMSILDREPSEITIIKEIDDEIIAVRGNGTKAMDVSTVLLEYFGVKSTISRSMQHKIDTFNRLKLQKELSLEDQNLLKETENFLGGTVASNFIYDRKYLKFLEYIQTHKNINFDKYEQVNGEEMHDLLKEFGDFFDD